MATLSRWLAPMLAAGLGVAVAIPAPARAQDDLVHILVHVADVVVHGGFHYYRYGDYGYGDRLIVRYDPYGHPIYYRTVPRYYGGHYGGHYGVGYYNGGYYKRGYYNAYRSSPYGYYRGGAVSHGAKCNKHGKCKGAYYDRGSYYDERAVYDRYYNTGDYRYRRIGGDRYRDGRRGRHDD